MIKLRGKTEANDINNKIIFEPRPGFTRGRYTTPTLEFPLIYGHRCPYCSNVMQALFKAPRTFSLWPYEETTLLSQGEKNAGDIRKTFPDDKTKFGKSCYRVDFNPSENGSVKITLRNHISKHCAIEQRKFNGEGLWEVGYERPCTHTGIFSLREDLLVKDWLLFSQMSPIEIVKYNIPSVKELIQENNVHFKLVPAVGIAPPVILIERQTLVYGFNYHTRPMMAQHIKKAVQ
jgi:hypothetical protein